ncbi:M3 family oligoendopeptidase [bacterium]|nr:M3 family oligoendopeptidase [bacterium]
MNKNNKLENIRWDLKPFYESVKDAKIKKDIERVKKLCNTMIKDYKGKFDTKLEDIFKTLIEIEEITSKIYAYFYLMSSRDADNQEIKKQMSAAIEEISKLTSNLSFFDIELANLSDKNYKAQLDKSELLKKHKPFMDKIRENAKYLLDEKVETILSKISPFGESEWDDMMDEEETKLSFKLGRKNYNLSEILHLSNSSHKAKVRQKALTELNNTLKSSGYENLRTHALNVVMGEKNLMDEERGFKHILSQRNIDNNLDDKTVNALHEAVIKYGSVQGKRYYNIIKKLLKKKTLLWSDRNAPIPFESKSYIDWDKCVDIVMNAYNNFSPTLANLIKDSFKNNRIDAPVYKGKTSGAYNYTIITNGGKVYTWTFLNYLGTVRDVMTLAHELGHSVHGQLAGETQGVLQAQAPMAYAETASIFGEMLTFEYLLSTMNNKKEKLALLLSKANDWINSVNRQISFSMFEQKAHTKRKEGKLSTEDFNNIWLDVSKQMYGEDGEIFTYKNMENLWCYVGHFMRPFYVYAYSFGELFTQSLFAIKNENKEKFEKLYLEMLKSGSTKNAVELMKPFGLDPTKPDFWERGINISIKKWLDEAESLMKELKIM